MQDDQSSRTAQYIAANVALAADHPVLGELVPADAGAETVRYLRSIGGWFGAAVGLSARLPDSVTGGLVDRIPAEALAHPVLRKRWIEDVVRSALGDCTQVVILGAGFDTLASRLHREFSTTQFWELDHPATQRVKRRAVDAGSNLTLLAEDFTDRPPMSVLDDDPDYDPTANTVVVAEGLLMYLSLDDVGRLFDAVRNRVGPSGRLVATAVDPSAFGGSDAFSAPGEGGPRWLHRLGEPWHWTVGPGQLPGVLTEHDLELTALAPLRLLRAQYLPSQSSVSVFPVEYCFEAGLAGGR